MLVGVSTMPESFGLKLTGIGRVCTRHVLHDGMVVLLGMARRQ